MWYFDLSSNNFLIEATFLRVFIAQIGHVEWKPKFNVMSFSRLGGQISIANDLLGFTAKLERELKVERTFIRFSKEMSGLITVSHLCICRNSVCVCMEGLIH